MEPLVFPSSRTLMNPLILFLRFIIFFPENLCSDNDCLHGMFFRPNNESVDTVRQHEVDSGMRIRECSCSSGMNKCSARLKDRFQPKKQVTVTNDTMIDLTGHDINDYILLTTEDYIRKRYWFKFLLVFV